jgi:hypothetical protein
MLSAKAISEIANMFWLLMVGAFAVWLITALANVGGDLNDALLIVPAGILLFQLWPQNPPLH